VAGRRNRRRAGLRDEGGIYLSPWVIEATGVLIVLGGAGFWAASDRQSALIIGAGMTLATAGRLTRRLRGVWIKTEVEDESTSDG
jgi:hypothetical protein